MKKLLIAAMALSMATAANAADVELTKAEKAQIPADEWQAADPFEHYPKAYKDNAYGEAAPKPSATLIKPETPVPSKVFTADKQGKVVIKDPR